MMVVTESNIEGIPLINKSIGLAEMIHGNEEY
jgi:hypothetical protein